ncbi:hypothetical protein BDA96_10G201400 [Sorghum bicolor]|uniref:Uncharacterized protein n=1 Tax=Sorghum bicolor TaxID=4558 RepID=A0A921Q438_SORBI|nr:hypothetical protein BDA96_10G201400 [Sorghum bicolor]
MRMPLPGRAVLLAAAVESTPYLCFVFLLSFPSSPPRPVHHSTTAPAPPSCGEGPVTVIAFLPQLHPPTPAPPGRGKDAPPSPNPRTVCMPQCWCSYLAVVIIIQDLDVCGF